MSVRSKVALLLATSTLCIGLIGCGGSSSSGGGSDGSSPELLDSGFWGSAFTDQTYEKPYNAKGSIGLYELSCRHNGVKDGSFYIYTDRSAYVKRSDGSTESCAVLKVFTIEIPTDTNDINATKYSDNSTSKTTWYDTNSTIYYDTDRFQYDGQMIGITNNAFEAIIRDSGGTQTVRLYRSYKEMPIQ